MKNLRRRFVRTVLLVLGVVVVSGTLFSATIVMQSIQNSLRIGTYRLGADVLVVPEKYEASARNALLAGEPTSFYMKKDALDKVRAVDGVKNVSAQVFIQPASFSCCYSANVFIVGFDPRTDFTIKPWLEESIKTIPEGNEIVTGREIPVKVGDYIPFYGTEFKVVGTLEGTGMKFFDNTVFMPLETAYRMAEQSRKKARQVLNISSDDISAVLVQVKSDITPDRVAIRIEHDIPGVKAIVSDQVISTVRQQMFVLLRSIFLIVGVAWIMALLMIAVVFSMIVNERQREIGLMRAMGAKKSGIFRLIMSEAILLSGLGGILGVTVGGILVYSFKNLLIASLKMPYLWPSSFKIAVLVLGCIVLSIITGAIAALYPAYSVSKMEPYDAIRKGE